MSWLFVSQSLSDELSQYSVRVLVGGAVSIFVTVMLASVLHHRFHFTKKAFFGLLSGIVLATTSALTVININLIARSEDGSLTRRQAKISVYACDQEILILGKNTFLTGTAGTSTHKIYPNGDMEFVGYRVNTLVDATLGGFFDAIGGSISPSVVSLPYNDAVAQRISDQVKIEPFIQTNPLGERYLELRSGDSCDVTPSMISIFLYEYSPTIHNYSQRKLISHPEEYTLSDREFSESDCIVVIYGEPMDSTTRTCQGYPDTNKVTAVSDAGRQQ